MVAMTMVAMFVVIHAEAVFSVSATIFESVQQVMLFKKGEGAKDAAAIHRGENILHVGQRESIFNLLDFAPDKLAYGCRTYVMG